VLRIKYNSFVNHFEAAAKYVFPFARSSEHASIQSIQSWRGKNEKRKTKKKPKMKRNETNGSKVG
jgi:hypothetical protein